MTVEFFVCVCASWIISKNKDTFQLEMKHVEPFNWTIKFVVIHKRLTKVTQEKHIITK